MDTEHDLPAAQPDPNPQATENNVPKIVSAQEIAAVKKCAKEYSTARKFDAAARAQFAADRAVASGDSVKSWAVSTNLIGSFIDILCSSLYARDPDVSIRRAPQVEAPPPDPANAQAGLPAGPLAGMPPLGGPPAMQPPGAPPMLPPPAPATPAITPIPPPSQASQDSDAFARTLELVVSRLWKSGRLKATARRMIRSTLSVGPGWFKAVLLSEKIPQPEMQQQADDARVILDRLVAKQKEIDIGDQSHDDLSAQIAEKQTLMDSLVHKMEVSIKRFLAIDFCAAQDVQVSLDVDSIADHINADWNGNHIYVPKDQIIERFPDISVEDMKKATEYYQREPKSKDKAASSALEAIQNAVSDRAGAELAEMYTKQSGSENSTKFCRVIEKWDRRDHHIYTWVEGVERWAKDPYQPPYATSRFFPYFYLGFYEVDGKRHPQSLTDRVAALQDEYCCSRSNFRQARERSIPGILFNASQIGTDEIARVKNAASQEFVPVHTTTPDVPMQNLFMEKPIGKIDPRVYDTAPILSDMERMTGVQEAQQSTVSVQKTATEANIQQQGFASRTGTDRDVLETMLVDFAQYTVESAMQCLTTQDAQKIAGPFAFWPEGMALDDILTMVNVDIQAGTTGKPRGQGDREAWGVVMPMLKESIGQIQVAQAHGNQPMVRALSELVFETMRRFGDDTDPMRFIPQGAPPPPPPRPPPEPPKISVSLRGELPLGSALGILQSAEAVAHPDMAPPVSALPGTLPPEPGAGGAGPPILLPAGGHA